VALRDINIQRLFSLRWRCLLLLSLANVSIGLLL
jgi:hypothetical protein